VRMAAGLHIGIDTNGHGWRRVASLDLPRGLFDQNLEFCFRFDIKEQYSGPASAPRRTIVQCLANLVLVLAHAGKNDAIAANANSSQVLQLTAGDNVEATSHLRQMVQDGKIAVRLDRKAQRMRQRSQAAVEFSISIFDGR